jgi:hypothetical protein
MKKLTIIALVVGTLLAVKLLAGESLTPSRYEYVTIRWAGLENTHIIRPGGQVEFIGMELRKMQRPERVDQRSFYLNCAMNGLTKEGYEFAGISSDDIVMKKAMPR